MRARFPAGAQVHTILPMDDGTDFTVTAIWDDEANVFTSESDIPGLVVEAETFDAFVEVVSALAPEVIAANLPTARRPHRVRVAASRALVLGVV